MNKIGQNKADWPTLDSSLRPLLLNSNSSNRTVPQTDTVTPIGTAYTAANRLLLITVRHPQGFVLFYLHSCLYLGAHIRYIHSSRWNHRCKIDIKICKCKSSVFSEKKTINIH